MNHQLKMTLAALAGAALAAQTASAYSDGDLILGVRLQNNTGNNYEVNLGNFGNFDHMDGSTFSLAQVSVSDLSSIFGAGWVNGTSGGQNLRWGVGAVDNNGGELFLTEGRPNPAVQTSAFNNITVGSYNNGNNNLTGVGNMLAATTLNIAASDPNSYSSRVRTTANYQVTLAGGTINNIENGLNVAGGPIISDLYEVLPTSSGKSTYLGFFSFTDAGVSFTSVPEPGSLTLAGAGFTALFLRQQLRRKQA